VAAAPAEDGGQEQREEKQDVIGARPDVAHALADEAGELGGGGTAGDGDLDARRAGAEDRGRDLAAARPRDEAAVLRVDIEEEAVFDGEPARRARAVGGELERRVAAVAVAREAEAGRAKRAGFAVGGELEAGQDVRRDRLRVRAELASGHPGVT